MKNKLIEFKEKRTGLTPVSKIKKLLIKFKRRILTKPQMKTPILVPISGLFCLKFYLG